MTLPARSEVKEDVLPLQRALRALEDAKRALKQFSQTGSVEGDPALSESVEQLRGKVRRREIGHGRLPSAGSKSRPTDAASRNGGKAALSPRRSQSTDLPA